jgi:hypothetical protein
MHKNGLYIMAGENVLANTYIFIPACDDDRQGGELAVER